MIESEITTFPRISIHLSVANSQEDTTPPKMNDMSQNLFGTKPVFLSSQEAYVRNKIQRRTENWFESKLGIN